jgi:hypoxanthine phosphoribosyltransferase
MASILANMRVVECLGEDFTAHCTQLAALVSGSYDPDLIVGVQQGGADVARQMQASGLFRAKTCLVSASRPSSMNKRLVRLDALLGRLPRLLLDRLRIVEHRARIWHHAAAGSTERAVQIPDQALAAFATALRILIVDDAVDSGETLRAVTSEIRRVSTAQIRTAAITVTFPEPLVEPDFVLERNVLMRFPWSLDAGRPR